MKNFEEFVTSASPPPLHPHRHTRSRKNTKAGFIFFTSIFFSKQEQEVDVETNTLSYA